MHTTRGSTFTTLRRLVAASGGLALVAALAAAAPASAGNHDQAGGGDPPGNNGTVKIDGQPFDAHPDNEPHVGCVFQIDFYGFDAVDEPATIVFNAQAPTGAGEELARRTVDHGEDAHDGGGSEAGLDAQETVDLTGALATYTPHPQQGYHVKLTVHAPGSQGADTKHKVFWIEPCEGAGEVAASGEASRGRSAEARGRAAGEGRAVDRAGAVKSGQAARVAAEATPAAVAGSPDTPRVEGQVLGITEERALPAAGAAESARAAAPAGIALARTGAGLASLVVAALGLIVAGLLLVGRLRPGFAPR